MTPDAVVVWLFPAVGTPRGVRLRGRAFRRDPDRGRNTLFRNIRSIAGARELPHAEVTVTALGYSVPLQADEEGFFTWELDGAERPLPLGVHPVTACLARSPDIAGTGTLTVVPDAALSVISDFDDTIAITHVKSRRRMLHTALFRSDSDHRVVPGMAAFYRSLARAPGSAFHYLSGTPVGLFRRTMRFLERHGFPPGAVILRHLELDPLDALVFKPPRLTEIADRLPGHGLLLIGDSGEKDPEVYAQVRDQLGEERVRRVMIRRVTTEPVESPRFAGAFVFDRPSQAAAEAVRLGLMDAADLDAIAAAENVS
jgi:phosphatidate phosphatase APP1